LREYHILPNAAPSGTYPSRSIMQDARGPPIPGARGT